MNEPSSLCDRLSAFADHALSPEERSEYERHLENCPDCRRILAAMSLGLERYRQDSQACLPTNGLAKLKAEVSLGRDSHFTVRSWMKPALVAGLALVIFSIGYWTGQRNSNANLSTASRPGTRNIQPSGAGHRPRPPFTVALAESIPVALYPGEAIPH